MLALPFHMRTTIAFAIAALAGSAANLANAGVAPQFAAPILSTTQGTDPWDIAVADLNGDSKPDAVVTDYTTGTIEILNGNGDGTFGTSGGAPNLITLPYTAMGIALRDVNGDSHIDILASLYSSDLTGNPGALAVVLNNGNGTFGSPAIYSSGGQSGYDIAIADADGDGVTDAFVANNVSGNVGVLLNNGNGSFGTSTTFSLANISPPLPFAIGTGDVNHDGFADIISFGKKSTTGWLTLLTGNGQGSFQPAAGLSMSANHKELAVADVDADGMDDIAITHASGLISVFLSRWTSNSFTPVMTQLSTGGPNPNKISIARLDSDSAPDLVVTNSGYVGDTTSASIGILAGKGDGTFTAASTFPTGGSSPWGVAVADINGDGRQDVTTANSGSVAALLNTTPFPIKPSIVNPGAGSAVAAGSRVDVRAQVRDGSGQLLSDSAAMALAAKGTCNVKFSATGVQAVSAPQCMKYNAVTDEFYTTWRVGRASGAEQLRVDAFDSLFGANSTATVKVSITP